MYKALPTEKPILFPPYRLDPANECVWLGPDAVVLTRKAYGVLRYLLQHPARMVTKEELLDAVWPETHVGEGVLKVAVAELRKALNDNSREPLYIETAHRRGYRFIGEIQEPGRGITARGSRAVSREAELAQIEACAEQALEGERQIVFITGETGIGKTTLMEAFLDRAAAAGTWWAAQGQCLEHFGESEPYLPVLEAITRLCRQPGGESLVPLLRKHAPTWLAQMPSLITDADRDLLRRDVPGGAKERMLREITEAIEAFTAETPLLLVLEDLHWSDYATVDLISYLARRRGRARLLLIGTYRPAEVIVKQHPLQALKRELQVRGQCDEVAVEFLPESAIAKYLALRFPASDLPERLAPLIHQRTDGNPLFVVNVVDYLVAQKQIVGRRDGEGREARWTLGVPLNQVEIGLPESLQQMIERQLELLAAEEQEMLSVASVAGLEFSTRTLAGATGMDVKEVSVHCHNLLKRRQFLRPASMIQLHDGSLLERYGFIHGIYQQALYQRVAQHGRVRLHRALGDFQEAAYAQHLREIAGELAVHFEEGRDYARAVQYRRLSAENASRRYSNREAIEHLGRALNLIPHFNGPEGAALEGALLEERAAAKRAMDDNVGAAADLERVVECASEAGQPEWQVKALLKLSSVLFWTDHRGCLAAADEAVERSGRLADSWLHLQARGHRASRRIRLQGWRDEDFQECEAARASAKAGDPAFYAWHTMSYAFFQSFRSHGLEACRAADEGIEIGLDTGDAFLYMSCLYFKAWALLHLGQWGEALTLARQGVRLSQENGHTTGEAVLRMIEARLHLEASDFSRAQDLARQTLPHAREGFARFITLIALGEAQLGLREYEAAKASLEEVIRASQDGPLRVDWIFQLPLYRAWAELWLELGDLDRARAEAIRLCDLAALPPNRTYLALGKNLLARIALARSDYGEAEAQLAHAMEALDPIETPLAEWRVFRTAAELANRQGRTEDESAWSARATSTARRRSAYGKP